MKSSNHLTGSIECVCLVIVMAYSVLLRKCIPYPIYQACLGRYSSITWSVSHKLRSMQSSPSPKRFKPDRWKGHSLAGNNLFIWRTVIFYIIQWYWGKKKNPTFLIFPGMFFKWRTTPGKVVGWHRADDVMLNGFLVLVFHLSNLRLYQNFLLCDCCKHFSLCWGHLKQCWQTVYVDMRNEKFVFFLSHMCGMARFKSFQFTLVLDHLYQDVSGQIFKVLVIDMMK